MSWAIRQEVVTEPTPRHVLLVLANYAGADGEDAFPSVDRLAKETGMSARSVQRALRVLEDAGLIAMGNQRIAEAKGFAKNRTPTVYRMVMDLIHPENMGRHSVTSHNSGATNETARGDTDDIQGRHSVTLTIIEPSDNRHAPIIPKPKSKAPSVEIPDWVPSEAWNGFLEMRKKIKKPLTDRGVALALKKLGQLRDEGHDPSAVLDQSVMSNYQGLFPVKGDFRSGAGHRRQTAADLAEQNAIRMMQRMGMDR